MGGRGLHYFYHFTVGNVGLYWAGHPKEIDAKPEGHPVHTLDSVRCNFPGVCGDSRRQFCLRSREYHRGTMGIQNILGTDENGEGGLKRQGALVVWV